MAGTAFASLLRVFGEIHSNFVQYAPLYVGEGNHRRNPTASSNLALSAKIRNSKLEKKDGRREAPSVLYSPHEIPNLKGFATRSGAPRLPMQSYESHQKILYLYTKKYRYRRSASQKHFRSTGRAKRIGVERKY